MQQSSIITHRTPKTNAMCLFKSFGPVICLPFISIHNAAGVVFNDTPISHSSIFSQSSDGKPTEHTASDMGEELGRALFKVTELRLHNTSTQRLHDPSEKSGISMSSASHRELNNGLRSGTQLRLKSPAGRRQENTQSISLPED